MQVDAVFFNYHTKSYFYALKLVTNRQNIKFVTNRKKVVMRFLNILYRYETYNQIWWYIYKRINKTVYKVYRIYKYQIPNKFFS